MAIPRRPTWFTSGSMRCSTAVRNLAASSTSDGKGLISHRQMGLVADAFKEDVIKRLEGASAIGHNRYSTTGQSHLKNAQPFVVEYSQGPIAISHNGNLVNGALLRDELEHVGSIFQSTTDTEVIIHLIATSKETTLMGRIIEALSRVRGAYSLLFLDLGQDDRGARSLRLSASGAGKVRRGKKSRRLCVRVGDLRVGSDRSGIRPRRRTGRDHYHRSRRCWNRSSLFRRRRMPNAFSNIFISRVPTASCSVTTFTRCARRSDDSWRGRAALRPIWSRPCPTPACRRRWATPKSRKSRSSSA